MKKPKTYTPEEVKRWKQELANIQEKLDVIVNDCIKCPKCKHYILSPKKVPRKIMWFQDDLPIEKGKTSKHDRRLVFTKVYRKPYYDYIPFNGYIYDDAEWATVGMKCDNCGKTFKIGDYVISLGDVKKPIVNNCSIVV